MSLLAELLSSRARAEIFRLLFGGPHQELHVREIERQSGLSDSTVRQELAKLRRLDLVHGRKDSNRIYYGANRSHPLFPDIQKLVIKTVGIVDVLREALADRSVKVAFIFGSIARKTDVGDSDVDLMVIGDLGLRELARMLSGIPERIGREINPHVLTEEEFHKRIGADDHFLNGVLAGPMLIVLGCIDDLEPMAR